MERTIEEAFVAIPRETFLPPEVRDTADKDMPIPIGYGQTNSQPSIVAQMLAWLEIEPGQRILDVGSGSGWTSALMGYLTGNEGEVTAVEIIPELVDFARENCLKLDIDNVRVYKARPGVMGLPQKGPYDRILVSAAADELPRSLINQLRPEGKMVLPVHNTVYEMGKDEEGEVHEIAHRGFAFVPLMGS